MQSLNTCLDVQMSLLLFATLNDGLIQQPAYASLILMSLLTMIAAPMLLKKWLLLSY